MEGLHSDLPELNGQLERGTSTVVTAGATEPNYASSISFSSPGHSEPDSDFASDGVGRAPGQHRPGSSDDEASDDSTYGAKKRWHLISCIGLAAGCAVLAAAWSSVLLSHPVEVLCLIVNAMHEVHFRFVAPWTKHAS